MQAAPDQIQQQLMREAQLHQQQHATGQEQLIQNLMQHTQSPPQPAAQPAPVHLQPQAHQPAPEHSPAPQHAAVAAAPQAVAAEPAKGLIGRAMATMDAFVQKLGQYFEAKLPPSVLQEVKEIGQVMMQSGIKENPIPQGPDQVRGQALPGRAPEPMQVPHRG